MVLRLSSAPCILDLKSVILISLFHLSNLKNLVHRVSISTVNTWMEVNDKTRFSLCIILKNVHHIGTIKTLIVYIQINADDLGSSRNCDITLYGRTCLLFGKNE